MDVTREQLAWAAGFFDGEGYVGCAPSTLQLTLSVGQSGSPALLERVQAALGGLGSIGGPYGPYPTKVSRKPVWRLQLNGYEKVQGAIALLWEWLGPVKRAQAKQALLLAQTFPGKGHYPRPDHCKRGHPLLGENLYINPRGGRRVCRTCQRDYLNAYRLRKAVQ